MNKINKYLLAPLSLASLTLLATTLVSGAFLMSSSVSADNDSAVDQVSITVPISCTMSGSGMTSHNANIANGTYTADIGTTTLTAFCNDNSGFSIYATGYTGNEIGATNSNKLVGTSASNNATINTGTATTAGNPDTSNWAMKLTAASSPTPTYPITITSDTAGSFNSYHAVPNEYTKVATRANGTDIGTNAEGSTLTTTYAAYISKTQAADTYTGQVKYTLVHPASEVPLQPQPAVAGKIVYHPNSSAITGQMGNQTPTNNQLTNGIPLWASNFSRAGYGFAGWNDKYDYTGNFYGPNQTITPPVDFATNGLSLYAVWIPSAGSLQSDVTTACNGLTEDPNDGTADLSSVTALTDERDNNTYAIAKLADGKCWMIENLRLDDTPELTVSNTHNPSLPLTNTWWYSSDNDNDTAPTSNHLSVTTNPASTAWCTSYSSACNDQSMLATNNTTLFGNNTASSYYPSNNVYSYGNYYNWYSATAGHGKYGSSYGDGYHVPGDVCPAGWRLPKGGNKNNETNNEFWHLIVIELNNSIRPANYDGSIYPYYAGSTEAASISNSLRSYPNNFIYSGGIGNVNGSSISSRNSSGFYWSASGANSDTAFSMVFGNSVVYPGSGAYGKYDGWMVRCVSDV